MPITYGPEGFGRVKGVECSVLQVMTPRSMAMDRRAKGYFARWFLCFILINYTGFQRKNQ